MAGKQYNFMAEVPAGPSTAKPTPTDVAQAQSMNGSPAPAPDKPPRQALRQAHAQAGRKNRSSGNALSGIDVALSKHADMVHPTKG